MRLYCYTFHSKKIMNEGYLSVANNPNPQQLSIYAKRAGSENTEAIKDYLNGLFPGRTRSICCLTEVAPAAEYKHPYLNNLVHHADVVSFELEALLRDGLVEVIYCKDCSQTVQTDVKFENIYKIENAAEIDVSPLNWFGCDEKYGSPYNMLRHYMLVLTKGYIPPEYLCLEKKSDG